MKAVLKIVLYITSLTILFSCSDNIVKQRTPKHSQQNIKYNYTSNLKKDFAIALAQAMAESQPLRKFLKKEALKMFDKDYDILYQLVKNDKLSNGKTFREILLKNFSNKKHLSEIENNLPLLTIYIPRLPNNSFSARLWNTQKEIPHVAITMSNADYTPIFKGNGEEFVLKPSAIPAFPVVLIKRNERVITAATASNLKNTQNNGLALSNTEGMKFQFIGKAFNGTNDINIAYRCIPHEPCPPTPPPPPPEDGDDDNASNIEPKLLEAFNMYNGTDGWQRDYIYYNIKPSQTRGTFSYDFQEQIRWFSLQGDPWSALAKITDQGNDPKIHAASWDKPTQSEAWTEGFYEFKVITLFNAKNGLGMEDVSYFSAQPEELFIINYRKEYNNGSPIWIFDSVELKSVDDLSVSLLNWDLYEYASSIKITIYEKDRTVKKTKKDTREVTFATNFSVDLGMLEKVGLKFGGEFKETDTITYIIEYTEGSEKLGSVIINFGDEVITSISSEEPEFRIYSDGWFKIKVIPTIVQ